MGRGHLTNTPSEVGSAGAHECAVESAVAPGGMGTAQGSCRALGRVSIGPGHPVSWSSLALAVMEPSRKLRAVAAVAT